MTIRILTWRADDSGGNVWRSTDGRYAIVTHTLPETPSRTVYQARKIDQAMAAAYPGRSDLGYLLEETLYRWDADNCVDSAQAVCERDAFAATCQTSIPEDHPAIALARFWWPISNGTTRAALTVNRVNGDLVAQVIGMHRHDDTGMVPEPYTEINLTALGLAPQPGTELHVTTDHGPEPCNCGARIGEPHQDMCERARCEVTGQQRLLCTYFGGSPAAGMEALTSGRQGAQEEFETYFKAPAGHDCGQDTWQG